MGVLLDNKQQMDRITVDDPLFGKLSYHKKLVNNSDFDGKKHLCQLPFFYAEVRRHGGINLCCPQWNPAEVGNLFDESLESIWNGARANAIRQTILDGSYRYCNWDTCPGIRNKALPENTPAARDLAIKQSQETTPSALHLVVDHSCNLECPSCRIRKITQLAPAERDQGYRAVIRALDSMFPAPHEQHKTLSMDGSGEVFSSELYRHLFDTHPVFTDSHRWPNLRFRITTNGTMMTEKMQMKYKNMFDHLQDLEVSVDAGNRKSYEQVRVGGHWDLLWKNLRFFHDTTLSNSNTQWSWNVIMQKKNYQSLPELIDLAKTFTHRLPRISITQVLNWGTWSELEYLEQAVHLPQHPEHDRYLEIMDLPEVRNYESYRTSR